MARVAASIVVVLAVVAGATAVIGVLGRGHAQAPAIGDRPAARDRSGCDLRRSLDGYPSRYLTRQLPYRVHPPLPVSGWRSVSEPLRFEVMFHSLFHGYLVVEYRRDLPAAELTRLRSWVSSHSRARVVATPAPGRNAPTVDAAEWGWELRCAETAPSAAALERLVARRGL
ncbi:MAG TPA: DUF3105 domain-containing protein [Gaiellaceae bacterium]|jgi:hypothetical protein